MASDRVSGYVSGVAAWLAEEEKLRFEQASVYNQQNASAKRARLLMIELPKNWHLFQRYRQIRIEESSTKGVIRSDEKLLLGIAHYALRAAGDARAAFTLQGLSGGHTTSHVREAASGEISKYQATVAAGAVLLPNKEYLQLQPEEALGVFMDENFRYGQPYGTYLGMAGLAAVALREQNSSHTELLLPRPQFSPKGLQPWPRKQGQA